MADTFEGNWAGQAPDRRRLVRGEHVELVAMFNWVRQQPDLDQRIREHENDLIVLAQFPAEFGALLNQTGLDTVHLRFDRRK